MDERRTLILKLISSHIVLPIVFTVAAFWIRSDALLVNVTALTIVLIIYLAGYWEFFGLRFRRVFAILLGTVLLLHLAYRAISVGHVEVNKIVVTALSVLEAFLLVQLIRVLVVRSRKDPLSVEIQFPLRNGTFLITDGGNSKTSRIMNYHYYSATHRKNHTNSSMLYATDIVKLDKSYPAFLPNKNSAYPIFGESVFSPIDGTVVKVENTIPDNPPYSGNYPYNTGNTIVIRQHSYYLLIGHLKQGSIGVHVGDRISTGQLVARAGNSGLSERPHIHMQLTRSETEDLWHGTGICMTLEGLNLYKNRRVQN
jgi:hypothetical protein